MIQYTCGERNGSRLVAFCVEGDRFPAAPRRGKAGWSAVGETSIPRVTVECVDIGKNNTGGGRSLGRY